MMESHPHNDEEDASHLTDPSAAWGNMGGMPGDGLAGQQQPGGYQQQPQPQSGVPSVVIGNTPGPYYQPPVQQQQQRSYASPQPTTPSNNMSGSITRFATPDLQQQHQQQPTYSGSSYAARSQQAFASGQQQPQQQRGGYAERSAQAYTATPTHSQPGDAMSASSSYASRSAQAYSHAGAYGGGISPAGGAGMNQSQYGQPQLNQQGYAPQQQQPYNQQPHSQQPQPQQQQQQQQAYPQQQPPQQTPQGGSSYAARSAQAHSTDTLPQQQPQMTQNAAATFAGGSGTPSMPPQQQYQQYQQQQQQLQPGAMTPQAQALQQRLLTDATRKIQEHAYYMRQAMEQRNLPVVLDRAAYMVGELGGPPHGHHHHHPHTATPGAMTAATPNSSSSVSLSNTGASAKLTPKNYYELYMRALEEMPTLQDFLIAQASSPPPDQVTIVSTEIQRKAPFSVRELYDCVQYCPRVLSRLYLQITAGAALIESGEAGAKWVIQDLIQAVKCEQNPVRGLFLRHYLLTALRDKLPDTPAPADGVSVATASDNESATASAKTAEDVAQDDKGTVQDSFEFVLANFMEMNKLWVRIQHLPGEGKNKDVRKRRERERNDLRILVGTNLIRLSQLEHVTSKIYGEIILNQILDHIVTCGDPLSQAYLMDCLVQAFPDEYHIETLPILLNVCPRLRDKVNIRTILQGLMDRLANYLADEELLDESDTNEVKRHLARDSFGMFEECVQNVYNARGPKLTSREVIRLQTALLQFSVRCYPHDTNQVARCLGTCVAALRQANASYEIEEGTVATVPHDKIVIKALDEVSVAELEKLLSIPLDKWGLECLKLQHYSDLIGFLPWANRRQVAITLLSAVDKIGAPPSSVEELEELFQVIEPMVRDEGQARKPRGAIPHSAEEVARTTSLMANLGVSSTAGSAVMASASSFSELDPEKVKQVETENSLVCKLVHLINHNDTDVVYDLLQVARKHISLGEHYRIRDTMVALVYAALRLVRRVFDAEYGVAEADEATNGKDEGVSPQDGDASNEEKTDAGADAPEKEADSEETPKLEEKSEDVPACTEAVVPEDKKDPGLNEDDGVVLSSKPRTVNCRKVFLFIQESVASVANANVECALKLYLEMSLVADTLAGVAKEETTEFASIGYELLTQAFSLFEESIPDSKGQQRCIQVIIGTLLAFKSLSSEEYEGLITKTAQYAAKVVKKPEQCQLVALCAYLFYPVKKDGEEPKYSNAQRALECLQRSLKLAYACTTANPAHVGLFVELLEHYLFFFQKKNPVISHAYITGLVALIKEHTGALAGDEVVAEANSHFSEVVQYIKHMKSDEQSAELFAPIQVD